MSADLLLSRWTRAARTRSLADDLLIGAPVALVAAALGWRLAGPVTGIVLGIAAIAVIAAFAARRADRFDSRWLVRRLDADRADMEDSADLLLADPTALAPLPRLQRARIEARLAAGAALDPRPAWSTRAIGVAWGFAMVAVAAILLFPRAGNEPVTLAPSNEDADAAPGVPRLVGQRLRIVPPAYTGLPPRDEASLDSKAPQGSRLVWTLRFVPQPASASLALHDGRHLDLHRAAGDWTVGRSLEASFLYRVVPAGSTGSPPLHRIDAIPDTPPRVKVLLPDRSLTIVTPGQRTWPLAFEVSDDYGVAATARLRIIQTQGEGENITSRERMMTVAGIGSPRRRRFTPTLDLAALGFAAGNDLVAQLIVGDNRAPGPQTVRSPSLILRWPSDLGTESGGLEGMVKKTMPAYFRSQRQIIIDAEALLKARRTMTADRFTAKSDGIGVDQRILRLRYGQFLGEEAEGGPKAPPTADAPTADAPAIGTAAEKPPAAAGGGALGGAEDVLSEFGHTHDEAEAATLLDPQTRATLKKALDQMWQSELHLRQGQPQAALPFAYKALGFIKEVQQATRIFLARVGPELPPIEESRRMTGKRDGIASRSLAPAARDDIDTAPIASWQALAAPGADAKLDALEAWLRDNGGRVADPLGFVGAIDAVRRDPRCVSCRASLRGLLWSVLTRPAPGVVRRAGSDPAARRYFDALGGGR